MPVTRLDHFNIDVPKDALAEMRRFYVEVIGLTEGPRPDFAFQGHWLYSGGSVSAAT